MKFCGWSDVAPKVQRQRRVLFGKLVVFQREPPRKRAHTREICAHAHAGEDWQTQAQSASRCCEDSPHDDPASLCGSFEDQDFAFGDLFGVGPEQDLERLPWHELCYVHAKDQAQAWARLRFTLEAYGASWAHSVPQTLVLKPDVEHEFRLLRG